MWWKKINPQIDVDVPCAPCSGPTQQTSTPRSTHTKARTTTLKTTRPSEHARFRSVWDFRIKFSHRDVRGHATPPPPPPPPGPPRVHCIEADNTFLTRFYDVLSQTRTIGHGRGFTLCRPPMVAFTRVDLDPPHPILAGSTAASQWAKQVRKWSAQVVKPPKASNCVRHTSSPVDL
jgi:hypothetical protein